MSRVGFIGKDSEWDLSMDYNRTHPRLEVRNPLPDGSNPRAHGTAEILSYDDAVGSTQAYSASSSSWQQYQPQYQSSPSWMRGQYDTAVDEGQGNE